MSIPGNLEDIMQHLKKAAEVLKAGALVAEENIETKAIAARLLRMSKEADGYSEYIHSYFKPTPWKSLRLTQDSGRDGT